MFNFNFNSMFGDVYDAKIEVYIGDQLVQSDSLQAPQIILERNYLNLLQSIVADKSSPMSIKLSVKKDVYDDNDNYLRTVWNSVESFNYNKEEK